jgi:hypothetical protein
LLFGARLEANGVEHCAQGDNTMSSALISWPNGALFQKQRYSMAQPTKPLFRHLPISRQTSFVKSSIENWKDSWQFPCFFWIFKTRKISYG